MKRILGIILISILGVIAPVIPANADVVVPSTIYVATTGTANLPTGNSCLNPHFVGDTDTPIQSALDLAETNNAARMDFLDVGFASLDSERYTTIVLCEGTWTLSQTLVADANVIIRGQGYKKTILDGNDSVRILSIGSFSPTEPLQSTDSGFAARVQLSKVTMKNGAARGYGEDGMGGAVLIRGRDSFKATNVFFQGNTAFRGAAIAGIGDATDNPAGIDGSPSGDLVIDASAFANNFATDTGVFYANRYQRNDGGALLYNSSFFGNDASKTLYFHMTYGASIGNSVVDNQTRGGEAFYAADSIDLHGNVFAQDDLTTVCGSDVGETQNNLEITSDNVSTSSCPGKTQTSSGPTVVTYSQIAPAGIYWSDIIPVQRFGALSQVRDVWPTASNCQGSDALLNSRNLGQTDCDAGPWQQPESVTIQPSASTSMSFTETDSGVVVENAPSNGTNNLVWYSSNDLLFCKVDIMTGAVKTSGTGNCLISWAISGVDSEADLTDSEPLSFNKGGFWKGTKNSFTALSHGEITYFVSFDGVIDRLDSEGYEKAWVVLPAADWGGNTWSSAIDSEGNLYVTAWIGKVAKIIPSVNNGDPRVLADFVVLADTEIPSIAISPSNELYVSAFDAGTDGENARLLKMTTTGSELPTVDLPIGTRPGYIGFDRDENMTLVDYYDSTKVTHIEKSTGTATAFPNGFTSWGQQVSVDSLGDAYVAQESQNVISKLDHNGTYQADWLTLPQNCRPRGLVAGDHENLFVSCFDSGSILEIDIVTKSSRLLARAPFGTINFNQLFLTSSNQLSAPTDQGVNAVVDVRKSTQAELVLTSQVQVSGESAIVSSSGGSGTGITKFESATPSFCAVNESGLVTKLSDGDCKVKYSKRGDITFAPAYSSELTVKFTAVIVNNTSTTSPVETPSPVDQSDADVSASELVEMTTDVFKKLTPGLLATIDSLEAKIITQSKIKVLVSTQLKALTPAAIAALKPSTVKAITASRLKLLTAAQKKALTSAQLKVLSKVQRKALGR